MEFQWNKEQQAFRATVREFLDRHLPDNWERIAHGPGSTAQSHFSRQFCANLAAAGLLVPHWPQRWGGRTRMPGRPLFWQKKCGQPVSPGVANI